MGQILHIFRKDVRRHWPEIAVSLALLIAFAWNEPKQWIGGFDPDSRFWLTLLTPLVPVGWIFLILRVVQDECLVGDRQFWVTRPYQWPQLLCEKTLVVLMFVNIPLFLADLFLLEKAGFHPASYVSGLISLQLMWLLVLVLPAMTLGAVTSGIGQSLLAVLAGIIYLIAFEALTSSIPTPGLWRAEEVPRLVIFGMLVAVGIAVVLWQYARRRTGGSRPLILIAAAATVLITYVTPHETLIGRTYPRLSSQQKPPVLLAFDPSAKPSQQGRFVDKDKVWVQLPMTFVGVASDSEVDIEGMTVTIQAPGGHSWTSRWQTSPGRLMPARQHFEETFTIDKKFFDQVKSTPVSVRITVALNVIHIEGAARIVVSAGEFSLPGNGRCFLESRARRPDSVSFSLRRTLFPNDRLFAGGHVPNRREGCPSPAGTDWLRLVRTQQFRFGGFRLEPGASFKPLSLGLGTGVANPSPYLSCNAHQHKSPTRNSANPSRTQHRRNSPQRLRT